MDKIRIRELDEESYTIDINNKTIATVTYDEVGFEGMSFIKDLMLEIADQLDIEFEEE